ncbi:MAG TPA: LUD domain-containing protein [Bacteroidota bacterium]
MAEMMDGDIHPREVASKFAKESLTKAIAMALHIENQTLRANIQNFNARRYGAVGEIPDYELLKDRARQVKEQSVRDLPALVKTLTRVVEARGGHVFLARSRQEAVQYVLEVCKAHKAGLVVKAKSITSEELHLNPSLESAGIEVAETDLAEFILQVSKEQPSHIVVPAIHRSRERISALFKSHFRTDRPLETGEELTAFARDILRQKFLSADVGISGANLIAAEEGTILLVESEGNIRLATQLPAVHIAIAGIEKIIRTKRDFGVFLELLAASATGQTLSSYTNILEPPLELPILNLNGRGDTRREFHLVLVDNGRTAMREDPALREALYCIRCSACMNVCANFQAVGGHAFGGECYTGGIGGAWTVGTSGRLEEGRFAELCTGCSRCVPNCPVRIDIPGLNTTIKNRLMKAEGGASLQKLLFGNFASLCHLASIAPAISNWLLGRSLTRRLMERFGGVDRRRSLPPFARHTLVRQFAEYRTGDGAAGTPKGPGPGVELFADVYTNYNNPQVGMATVRVFDTLGIPITVSKVLSEGRASLSQGLVDLATSEARTVAAYLEKVIESGREIVVAEPSVLALFRYDYKALLDNDSLFAALAAHSYDPLEYVWKLIRSGRLDLASRTAASPSNPLPHLFYHAHCQLKSIGAAEAPVELLGSLGYAVDRSSVECCGMAGSFGYKKEYYELSKNVGSDLIAQIRSSANFTAAKIILASGTSCREQIRGELSNPIYHPIEYLEKLLTR